MQIDYSLDKDQEKNERDEDCETDWDIVQRTKCINRSYWRFAIKKFLALDKLNRKRMVKNLNRIGY